MSLVVGDVLVPAAVVVRLPHAVVLVPQEVLHHAPLVVRVLVSVAVRRLMVEVPVCDSKQGKTNGGSAGAGV